jgi:hypothetical protein
MRQQQELEERQQWELKGKGMSGKVNINGKEYVTVSYRVKQFRDKYPDTLSILTEITKDEDNVVIMKASIVDKDIVLATGYAEEVRGSTNINKTSALENCETSAIGRALASFGFAGTEYASADEVQHAIKQQVGLELKEGFFGYCSVLRDNIESITQIKGYIESDDFWSAGEQWFALGEEIQTTLLRAPSKGGMFTTAQVKTIREDLRKAYFEGDKPEDRD